MCRNFSLTFVPQKTDRRGEICVHEIWGDMHSEIASPGEVRGHAGQKELLSCSGLPQRPQLIKQGAQELVWSGESSSVKAGDQRFVPQGPSDSWRGVYPLAMGQFSQQLGKWVSSSWTSGWHTTTSLQCVLLSRQWGCRQSRAAKEGPGTYGKHMRPLFHTWSQSYGDTGTALEIRFWIKKKIGNSTDNLGKKGRRKAKKLFEKTEEMWNLF